MKKGDIVRTISTSGDLPKNKNYYVEQVSTYSISVGDLVTKRHAGTMGKEHFKVITKKEYNMVEQPKTKYYKQKKDSFLTKKGTIWRSYNHTVNNFVPIGGTSLGDISHAYAESYMKQKDWFEEVFPINPEYATEAQIKKLGLKVIDG